MKCEICDEQTATMWVEPNIPVILDSTFPFPAKQLVSCDDCGPQLGYKVLASLTSVQCHG